MSMTVNWSRLVGASVSRKNAPRKSWICLRAAFQWPGSNTHARSKGVICIFITHTVRASGRVRHRHNTVLMSRGRTGHYLCDLPDAGRTQCARGYLFRRIALDANHSIKNHFLIIFAPAGARDLFSPGLCFADRLIWAQGPLSRIIASTWAEIYAYARERAPAALVWVHLLVFLMVRTWTRQIMNIYGRIYTSCLCQLINCAGGKYLHDTRRCERAPVCKHIFAVTCIAGFLATWRVEFIARATLRRGFGKIKFKLRKFLVILVF